MALLCLAVSMIDLVAPFSSPYQLFLPPCKASEEILMGSHLSQEAYLGCIMED